MIKYIIRKDNNGKMKGLEVHENGKLTQQIGKESLPPQANWRAIENVMKQKKKGKS